MKRILWVTCFCTAAAFVNGQNVGIGTTIPQEKLEVRNSLRATLKVSSNNLSDTTELLLSNKISNVTGTDFSLKSVREEGLIISSQSDWGPFNSAHSLVIKPNGFVGVNDLTPFGRLSVTGNETTGNGMGAAIRIQNTASSNAWILRAGAAGTATPDGGFSIADNTSYHFMMDASGNLGLGITPLATKLHLNGGMKIQSTNVLEFGAGIAGKEVNAGKIAYNGFGTSSLAIVGAGTNSSNRSVFFFAEGGTVFNGPINLSGTIQLNSNAGQPGQVLTSNGVADPVWADAALTGNTRFAVRFTENAAKSGTATISGTYYNLNTSDVVIGASTITINKSGLYHFDVGGNGSLSYASATSFSPTMGIWLFFGLANSIQLVNDKLMTSFSSANTSYQLGETNSVEVYINAPATLSVYHTFSTLGTCACTSTHQFAGFLTGHLIAE
jgi:hypothetical protein